MKEWITWPVRGLSFWAWFAWQVVTTSAKVSSLIVVGRPRVRPGIVRVPVHDLTDAELTILTALITITPDTLVIALDREAQVMFVHGMFVNDDAEAFREGLCDLETRFLRGVRVHQPSDVRVGRDREPRGEAVS